MNPATATGRRSPYQISYGENRSSHPSAQRRSPPTPRNWELEIRRFGCCTDSTVPGWSFGD
ncbi:hypothetical protein [Thermoleptolyngbya sp.]